MLCKTHSCFPDIEEPNLLHWQACRLLSQQNSTKTGSGMRKIDFESYCVYVSCLRLLQKMTVSTEWLEARAGTLN
jgi:hypothetical protein